MANIVLIGMMGSGKSTLSKIISLKLNMPIIDTDDEIEKGHNQLIKDIFKEYGEAYFRDLENDYLKSCYLDHHIISTGGGMILREENRLLLREMGVVIYLRGSIQTLVERLLTKTDARPLLEPSQLSNQLRTLLNIRAVMYENTAHMIVDIDEKDIETISTEIYTNLNELGYNFSL